VFISCFEVINLKLLARKTKKLPVSETWHRLSCRFQLEMPLKGWLARLMTFTSLCPDRESVTCMTIFSIALNMDLLHNIACVGHCRCLELVRTLDVHVSEKTQLRRAQQQRRATSFVIPIKFVFLDRGNRGPSPHRPRQASR